jgi:hypothetical protein
MFKDKASDLERNPGLIPAKFGVELLCVLGGYHGSLWNFLISGIAN